jgi:hypothetical protein
VRFRLSSRTGLSYESLDHHGGVVGTDDASDDFVELQLLGDYRMIVLSFDHAPAKLRLR